MTAFTFDSPAMPSGMGNATVPRPGTMGQQGQQGVPVTRYRTMMGNHFPNPQSSPRALVLASSRSPAARLGDTITDEAHAFLPVVAQTMGSSLDRIGGKWGVHRIDPLQYYP